MRHLASAAALVVSLIVVAAGVRPAVSRTFWTVPLDTAAIGHFRRHTHVAVTGRVEYTAREDDGDLHIKLVSPSGAFIIAECIPRMMCAAPARGARITVRGISRQDSEHGWYEVHPVESWSEAP